MDFYTLPIGVDRFSFNIMPYYKNVEKFQIFFTDAHRFHGEKLKNSFRYPREFAGVKIIEVKIFMGSESIDGKYSYFLYFLN